ncbi:MAG: hypothetical protein JXJ04_11250 [Spirochaetales bacterium]|nr:hypothetical protein [Spirochaetales bacterium]
MRPDLYEVFKHPVLSGESGKTCPHAGLCMDADASVMEGDDLFLMIANESETMI